ncbi:MAG: nuclear transport factor 2 family protein [Novosphingobium sp.]|nr:nuclear transport factor 2 family protein [Novosphingobium sp.]
MTWMKGVMSGLGAVMLLSAVAAEASPMIAPGGLLDPAFADADVYIGKPESPPPPSGKACRIAARYVELVNAGSYAEVAALFAENATLLEPMRLSLQGRRQIEDFYVRRIGSMAPEVMAVAWFGNETECIVELARKSSIKGQERWVLVAADHFIIGPDGRIRSMTAFTRPPRTTE